jgi:hypothetical protein
MTTETMNLRAGIKERDLLDKRIASQVEGFMPINSYSVDNPYIGIKPPTQVIEEIGSQYQTINDLIRRREAINKAILETNAMNKVKVRKFTNFENIGKPETELTDADYEEITLANAINRKNYYKGIVVNLVDQMKKNFNSGAKAFQRLTNENIEKVNKSMERRFQGQSNISQTVYNDFQKQEIEKYTVELINPLKADVLIETIQLNVNEYLKTIDNILSNATETISITVEY